jgi:hypothetical protein
MKLKTCQSTICLYYVLSLLSSILLVCDFTSLYCNWWFDSRCPMSCDLRLMTMSVSKRDVLHSPSFSYALVSVDQLEVAIVSAGELIWETVSAAQLDLEIESAAKLKQRKTWYARAGGAH